MDLKDYKGYNGLHKLIVNQGWYGGKLKLVLETECAFEGFSGRASETWENRTSIEVISPEGCKIPSIKVVGKTYQSPDEIADEVLRLIKQELDK
jgi:hypothetical protein